MTRATRSIDAEPVRRGRAVALVAAAVVCALIAAACGSDEEDTGGGDAQTPLTTVQVDVTRPEGGYAASDIGVTADEIRIGVVADVENQFRPGFFEGVVDGVNAYADYVNERGGVAGRTLVVDFYDSQLNPDATQEAFRRACEENFAAVGTSAIFFTNIDSITDCTDQDGNATGLPDLALLQTSFIHQCAPTSYSMNGSTLDCDTADDAEQTYQSGAGAARWIAEELGVENAAWIQSNNTESSIRGTNAFIRADQEFLDGDKVFQVGALDPQATYTPFIQGLKRDGNDFVRNLSTGNAMAATIKEAALQGYQPTAWLCTTDCYNDAFLDEVGAQGNGVYIDFPYLPFEDRESEAVQTVIQYVGEDNLDPYNLPGWITAHLFATAAEKVVETAGEDGLTRAAFLDALAGLHDYDGFGLTGSLDVGNRDRNPCVTLFQVEDGEFVRVYPEASGELDCDEANLVEVTFDNAG